MNVIWAGKSVFVMNEGNRKLKRGLDYNKVADNLNFLVNELKRKVKVKTKRI